MAQAQSISQVSSPFIFQDHQIRTVIENDQLWFVAKDVCSALDISWNGATLKPLPESWQGMLKFHTPSGKQNLRTISEPAVYKLAFRSNKSQADEFTNWIAGEVVPSIRKTGKYDIQEQPALSSTLTPEQQCTLQNMVKALVERGGIYANIWSRFNNHFRLGSYKQLPQSRMGEAVHYLMTLEVKPKVLPETSILALPRAKPNPLFDFAQAQYINKSLSNKACQLTMDIEKQLNEWISEAGRSFNHSRRTQEIATLEDFVFDEHVQVLKRLSHAVFSNLMAFSVQCSSMAFMAQLLERKA